jgi:hypothetical protein
MHDAHQSFFQQIRRAPQIISENPMKKLIITAVMTGLGAACASAQQPQLQVMPAGAQIAAAVSPLPQEFRESAAVLGYQTGQKGLQQLRAGKGPFICLADDPADERFHVACYHNTLEAFMARGRQLRADGVKGAGVDSARYAEIEAGKLNMPKQPAALYSMTGKPTDVDTQTGAVAPGVRQLYVVYIPFATSESTGLPKTPAAGTPWIMFPGTAKAHIMFVPTMQ